MGANVGSGGGLVGQLQVIENLATIGPNETLLEVAGRLEARGMSRMGDPLRK
jgi:hypothetical protein